jgi:hypothetical protein
VNQLSDIPTKPLGRKAYGSIGHLPGSRLGPGDHRVNDGHARICLEALLPQRRSDEITVTEKLDGSCVAVAKLCGQIVALGRSGYTAFSSGYEQHQLFGSWVLENWLRFDAALGEGERLVGEWLAQAHGTLYDLRGREPFVAFDLMTGEKRHLRDRFEAAANAGTFSMAPLLHRGGPLSIDDAMWMMDFGGKYGADQAEGVVYRVESDRKGHRYVDFLAKYVRPGKIDGCYLPEMSGGEPVWNWRPTRAVVPQ